MGSSEAETSSKSPKKSSAQEEPAVNTSAPAPATPSYTDWSNYHAYSPVPPHGYYPTAVASSPQTHPYMWGPQAMMPPYVMYPPGGIYAHPSMPPGSHPFSPYAMPSPNGNTEAPVIGKEAEAKSSELKEKSLIIKRSKDSLGSLNMISAKLSGAISQSGESGSDSSTEGSDANSQNDSQTKASAGEEPFGDTAQNGKQPMAIGQVAAGPTTNLKIGMDYWRSPVETSVNNTLVPANNNTRVPSEQRILNERELKKLKRKQSNRESARRSRLRKQAECEELSVRAESLKQENEALKAEVERIKKEYNELINYNISLKKKIGESDEKEDKPDNEKKP